MNVSVAPSAGRDIERHYEYLKHLAAIHIASPGRHDTWFAQAEAAIASLSEHALEHPLAYERNVWGRDVRIALFARGYRILYEIHGEDVWVLRVRGPTQKTLQRPGLGSSYRRNR